MWGCEATNRLTLSRGSSGSDDGYVSPLGGVPAGGGDDHGAHSAADHQVRLAGRPPLYLSHQVRKMSERSVQVRWPGQKDLTTLYPGRWFF